MLTMKGIIVEAIEELITKNFGKEQWQKLLEMCNLRKDTFFLATEDVPDTLVFCIIDAIGKTFNLTNRQIFELFSDYWTLQYAPRVFSHYYDECKNAKEFLLKMDEVHYETTKTIPDANPPRFEYHWKDKRTLKMKYKSKRGLIDLMIALIHSVGKYYNENLKIRKLSSEEVEIEFEY
ncbi:MAG: heme NO-binding domain-containing protein [Leptospiraceae bacterium]|nr:heme NO-binding domain-containing protein [Leptospiraceae bacterium]